MFPSVQKAGNLPKRMFFHFGYQKRGEINCHIRSYPKRTRAISFLFLACEEFEKLLHVIIHTKRIGFLELGDSSRPTDVIGARARVYMYSCMHLPLISCDDKDEHLPSWSREVAKSHHTTPRTQKTTTASTTLSA